jgi:hypothetical protein
VPLGGLLNRHAGPLGLFAALTIGWTWPLAAHLGDALAGGPGDNYSFVWNLWWMRHVLSTPGLDYFHTTYLFYPFGTTIADHPHTALPALVAATVLKAASPATAQNLLLLGCVFANMASAYALCWEITRHRRAAVLGAMVFGLSPYLAAHLLGHFDLVAAWVLPLFAIMLRRAMRSHATAWSAGAGLVLAAAAYTAYYYVVYLLFFLAIYLVASLEWNPIRRCRRPQTGAIRTIKLAIVATMALLAAAAIWIVATGGSTMTLGPSVISARTPQNALTGIWLCAGFYALCVWRFSLAPPAIAPRLARRALTVSIWIVGVFAVAAAPLLWQAGLLVARGTYVSPSYHWRSAPRGVDVVAPLLGSPFHPWLTFAERGYASLHLDRIETVGWIGIVPLLLLCAALADRTRVNDELRIWRLVGLAFAVWALGPILTVAGFDTGLKLPAILLRYVPFVANARMPGRAMVGVFMALAVLIGAHVATATESRRAAAWQWLLVALVAFEYWDSPIPLTPIDRPAVYQRLAAAAAGAVCEVPFGIGDGLSTGVGSQDRRVLYYATVHQHPIAGGYVGRMPADAAERYERMALAGDLLRLSDGRTDIRGSGDQDGPCRYLVVNRGAMSPALRAYLGQLPLDRIASDQERDLYTVRSRTLGDVKREPARP